LAYVHPDQYYDSVDYNPVTGEHGPGVIVTPVTHKVDEHEVTDTYVFVRATHLPLLAPARQIFGALGLTLFTEPVLSAIEPVLRLLVDMGYTDRENLHPEDHVPFSLITPPARIIETIAKVPGALGQGVNTVTTGVGSAPTSIPPVAPTIAPKNSPSINARSLPQEPQEDSLVNDDPPAVGVTDPAPPQTPSGSGTSPTQARVSPLSKSGPILGVVTEDGNKVAPSTTSNKTTAPKKNVFKGLSDLVQNLFSPKKPAPSTPSSEPSDPAPSGSTSEGSTSNAA
jgi:hypothetical protein